jgi:hypothetical protein
MNKSASAMNFVPANPKTSFRLASMAGSYFFHSHGALTETPASRKFRQTKGGSNRVAKNPFGFFVVLMSMAP